MRDVNPRKNTERFELSLDGRQIASVVVGAIVVLAVVFVLGLNVGKQIGRDAQRAQPAGGDALKALDAGPVTPPPAVRDESLTYHDRLVKERPSAPPAEPRPPPPTPPAPAPTPDPAPAPMAAPAPEPAPEPEPAASSEPEPPKPAGAWCVQVGAANERPEAERIAAKFERFKPRIEHAVLQGKDWYRVRIGAFEAKGDAEKFMKDLARETGAKGFVTATR